MGEVLRKAVYAILHPLMGRIFLYLEATAPLMAANARSDGVCHTQSNLNTEEVFTLAKRFAF